MQEPKLYWGVKVNKQYGGDYTLGISVAKENINGKASFYIHLGLILWAVAIGRLW